AGRARSRNGTLAGQLAHRDAGAVELAVAAATGQVEADRVEVELRGVEGDLDVLGGAGAEVRKLDGRGLFARTERDLAALDVEAEVDGVVSHRRGRGDGERAGGDEAGDGPAREGTERHGGGSPWSR